MDSEDDTYDSNLDSLADDDEFYGEVEVNDDFFKGCNPDSRQNEYVILTEEGICRRQKEDIASAFSVLSVSEDVARILLIHSKWNVTELHEAWFTDEIGVRRSAGIFEAPVVEFPVGVREFYCKICMDLCPVDLMRVVSCGHPFCVECWKGYIASSIKGGIECLVMRCPDPSCTAAVGQDMVHLMTSDEDRKKYDRYFVRSYIESNKRVKWCPAPDCECAVELVVGSESYEVCCRCSYTFCWNCSEEKHRPVHCDMVAKWVAKTCDESENIEWLLAYTKLCPKCRKPIEKNQGCMHMTCRPPCQFEFCWLCLAPWSNHKVDSCNKYVRGQKLGSENKRRKRAKMSIEKYTHYYERWRANHVSMQSAVTELHKLQAEHTIEKLGQRFEMTAIKMDFIREAWEQIAECRRVLKWTYVSGYYLPTTEENNEDESVKNKKEFFEFVQSEAERGLERLHEVAEKEFLEFISDDKSAIFSSKQSFLDFREKLVGLTRVTRDYFVNLVTALENDLAQ